MGQISGWFLFFFVFFFSSKLWASGSPLPRVGGLCEEGWMGEELGKEGRGEGYKLDSLPRQSSSRHPNRVAKGCFGGRRGCIQFLASRPRHRGNEGGKREEMFCSF